MGITLWHHTAALQGDNTCQQRVPHGGVFLQHQKLQQQNMFPRVYCGSSSVLTHRAHGVYAYPLVIDAKISLYILLGTIHLGTDGCYSSTSRLCLTVPDQHKRIRRGSPSKELVTTNLKRVIWK